MTGVLNAMVGRASGLYYSVTMADINSLGSIFGYNDSGSPAGSISPSTWLGVAIKVVQNNTSTNPDQFGVTLAGSRAQSFFRAIEIQKTDGSFVTLMTADATYSDLTTITSWVWVLNTTWTAATPSPRRIRFFL
jgi:hypothetical protein